ncbi:MAG: sigma-54-dependent Fis family transcriptional regulator [Bacteroidetes bacterium]|nr:sigma-54-dependent Fis family transcriptional regulator [Bacteroidota bacterium]
MEIQSVKQRFGIIGNSPGIHYALEVATRVAPTNLTVLITGESGVGKEIFSQIIHQYSTRKHAPFIAVNCGAIPEGTIDSELFGHEKGAFTGASDSRKGYFETVNGGTIFLDEVGELPLGTQARLLRVLESGEFIRVGSSKSQKTDVRVVAATNVNLPELISRGKFREDLYYRLNTVPINVPALRERADDIFLLFRKFAADFAERYRMPTVSLDPDARRILEKYPWPGNVRELKNIAEQVSVLANEKTVSGEDLGRFLPELNKRNLPVLAGDASQNGLNEREILYKVLFEMRKDLNDLKRFVWQLAGGENGENGSLRMPSHLLPEEAQGAMGSGSASFATGYSPGAAGAGNAAQSGTYSGVAYGSGAFPPTARAAVEDQGAEDHTSAIVIDAPGGADGSGVEESLSIADKEKELIEKALLKHKGKRKDAALDLGISERTLYRKIKEYEIIE